MIMSALKWGWVTALYGVEKEIISPNTQHSNWSEVPRCLCHRQFSPSMMTQFSRQTNHVVWSSAAPVLWMYLNHLKIDFSLYMNGRLTQVERPVDTDKLSAYSIQQQQQQKSHNRLPGIHMVDYKKVSIKREAGFVRTGFIENRPDTSDYSLSITRASVITRSR